MVVYSFEFKELFSIIMRVEIPTFERCCFCVPLLHGILIFGYLNLILSVLFLSLTSWMMYGSSLSSPIYSVYKGVNFLTQLWFPVALLIFDIIFNVVLIIGVHMNKTLMIRVYYYYGVMTTVAAFLVFLMARFDDWEDDMMVHLLDTTLAFSGIVIQVYLLLLIHSELDKRKQRSQRRYVNHLAEFSGDPALESDGRNPL